jgi:hypothetical protein
MFLCGGHSALDCPVVTECIGQDPPTVRHRVRRPLRFQITRRPYNQGLPNPPVPSEILAFIRACIAAERVRWTYHVTMRLQERRLNGDVLREAAATLEIVEEYPHDKYLPSYLLRGEVPAFMFHALIATDIEGDNIRVVTMYVPDSAQWNDGGRVRRTVK